jgi:hypothetical protein
MLPTSIAIDLRSSLNVDQFALDAAYIGYQLDNGQRVSTNSEIAVLARLELDLRRRGVLPCFSR